ncbi:MAG TPA: hypothetical protein VK172_14840 [Lentimicrobium sp.]|nr:hypothetical protein [Bacteroidales bacterium]HLO92439.1 hypothetical protein [Lentimicrobium sp.]
MENEEEVRLIQDKVDHLVKKHRIGNGPIVVMIDVDPSDEAIRIIRATNVHDIIIVKTPPVDLHDFSRIPSREFPIKKVILEEAPVLKDISDNKPWYTRFDRKRKKR